MRDFSGLERIADDCLRKEAGVMGDPKSIGGAVGQTALYATPLVGSGLSIADGIKNFRNGEIWSGLGNIGLGLGTAVADIFSLGSAGSAIRGTAAAARAGRAAKAVVGARNAARLAKGVNTAIDAVNGANKAVKATKAVRGAAKATKALERTRVGRATVWGGRQVGGVIGLPPARTALGRMAERGVYGDDGLGSALITRARTGTWDGSVPEAADAHAPEALSVQETPVAKAVPEVVSSPKTDTPHAPATPQQHLTRGQLHDILGKIDVSGRPDYSDYVERREYRGAPVSRW